jgi:hypothetical protein
MLDGIVYTFFVVNTQDQTRHLIMVDAGNAKVLYASQENFQLD